MEDGYFHRGTKTPIFCTEGFTKNECTFLCEILASYSLKARLNLRNKNKDRYRIQILKESVPQFIKLIKPYIHEVFIYIK